MNNVHAVSEMGRNASPANENSKGMQEAGEYVQQCSEGQSARGTQKKHEVLIETPYERELFVYTEKFFMNKEIYYKFYE